MNGIFLDWAATSPIVRFPIDTSKQWRNPNAAYAYEERKVLMNCEERIKAAIGAKDGHVLYFRCATEAIEWLYEVTSGAIDPFNDWWGHSPYAHDCCLLGHECMPYDKCHMDFYCHQSVNHITGEVFNPAEIRAQLNDARETLAIPYFICDCTAAFGKIGLDGVCKYADVIFMSGHKIGCSDIAFMWIDDRLFDRLGGSKDVRNQWGLKHGSISVGHVLALADAVEWACDEDALIERDNKWFDLVNELDRKLDEANVRHSFIPILSLSEAGKPFALAINAIRLNGLNADALQQYCASKGVYIGVGGSACNATGDFRVLNAYGLTNVGAAEVIRVSFGDETTKDDIDKLVSVIKEYKERFVV